MDDPCQEDTDIIIPEVANQVFSSSLKGSDSLQQDQRSQDKAGLSSLPTELHLEIIKHLLPNTEPVRLRTHCEHKSEFCRRLRNTRIASVSKYFSRLVSEVLYRDRWFEVNCRSVIKSPSTRSLRTRCERWDVLAKGDVEAVLPKYPIDCLRFLLQYTPAQDLLTHVRLIVDDPSMVTGLGSPRFLQVLQRAKGLRVVEIMIDMEIVPSIVKLFQRSVLKFVEELGHVEEITLTHKEPRNNPETREAVNLLAAKLVERNKGLAELIGRRHAVTQEMYESETGMLAATPRLDRSNGEV